jgi:hypothetical protein
VDHCSVGAHSGALRRKRRSDPDRVVLTTTDSNVWGGSSGYTYIITQLPSEMTDVDVTIVREGKNVKGRLLGLVLCLTPPQGSTRL